MLRKLLVVAVLGVGFSVLGAEARAQFIKLPSLPRPNIPNLSLPKPNSPTFFPSFPKMRYKTNKFEQKARVEAGGWVVAWADDVSERDAASGVVAVGASVVAENPGPFLAWVDRLVQRTVNSMSASAKRKFPAALRAKAKQAAADVISAAIRGKSAKEVVKKYDTVDFKAGAIRYTGGNYLGNRLVGGHTWGMKPYIAFRIR